MKVIKCLTCGKKIKRIKQAGRPRLYCNNYCRGRGEIRLRFWYSKEQSEKRRAWRKANAQRLGKWKLDKATAAKAEGIKHYGGKCECCGEKRIQFLTIEHKNGRQESERGKTKCTGKRAWLALKWSGWPKDITILCWNCNCAKGAFGICPHQTERLNKERRAKAGRCTKTNIV